MLGFKTFSGSPIASTGSGAIVNKKAEFYAEALLQANANADWSSNPNIIGEAMLKANSTVAGSGWVRVNPDTPEWDMDKSQDWNQIK